MEEVVSTKEQVPVVSKQTDSRVSKSPFVGFWPRFAAFTIDSAIVTVIGLIAATPISILLYMGGSEGSLAGGIIQILFTLLSPLYFVFFTHRSQSTWGKRFIGIKVLSEDGHKLSFGKIVLRETVGRIVNMVIMCVGYIIVAFTTKKQGLHDMLAGSVVVRIDPTQEISKGRVAFGILIALVPVIVIVVIVGLLYMAFNSYL